MEPTDSIETEARLLRTVTANPYIPHTPTPKQRAFLALTCEEAFYGGAAGGGKALEVQTPILTMAGWRTMGDLTPGEWVFGADGNPTMILACSPVMHRECYVLRFSDGEEIVADADHLWHTETIAERSEHIRKTESFRAARRASRPSRGKGVKPWLAARNKRVALENRKNLPGPSGGRLRTTREIAETLLIHGRRNHSVAVAPPLVYPRMALPIEPYILGVWLGDGKTTEGSITTADEMIVAALERAGYKPRKQAGRYQYGTRGLRTKLRVLGVLGNKHIPRQYLCASKEQRLALLQGLMDTDGTACPSGATEFYTTRPRLARDVLELIRSLGIKASLRLGTARLRGKDCGPLYRIKMTTDLPMFRLRRKAERQKTAGLRATQRRRYIVAAEPVGRKAVRCIKVAASDGMFLAGRALVPTHNSDALLMAALQYVEQPGYSAILFRRTYTDLSLPGALMDRAAEWLSATDARWEAARKTWVFPSGATLAFGYLEGARDHYRYQGAEFQYVGFDELTEFTEAQYRFLFSRLRRLEGSKVPLRMRAASNPGGVGHEWVRRRFLDEGESAGRIYIPARLEDNPYLDAEQYEHSLAQLDPVTRAQLRYGDWEARAAGGMFQREWFRIAEAAPASARWGRW